MKTTLLTLLCTAFPAFAQINNGMWASTAVPSTNSKSTGGFDTVVDQFGRQFFLHTKTQENGSQNLVMSVRENPRAVTTQEDILIGGLSFFRELDLEIDSNGGLHLATITKTFLVGISVRIRYGYRPPGGDWTFSTIPDTSVSSSEDAGHGLSLSVGSDGRPAIAYTGENGTLRYASRASLGAWSDIEITDVKNTGLYPSLKKRQLITEPVVIAHYDIDNRELLFSNLSRQFQGGSLKFLWNSRRIDNLNNPGLDASIAELAGGDLGISYRTLAGVGELRLARRSSGTWTSEVVDTPFESDPGNTFIGFSSQLTTDALGCPQVTYGKGKLTNLFTGETIIEEIRHARQLPDGSWGVEAVRRFIEEDPVVSTSFSMSLSTDTTSLPHLMYYRGTADETRTLRSARPLGNSWTAEDLSGHFPDDSNFRGTSFALGKDGTRVIGTSYSVPSDGAMIGDRNRFALLTQRDGESELTTLTINSFSPHTSTTIDSDGRIEAIHHGSGALNGNSLTLDGLTPSGSFYSLNSDNSAHYDFMIASDGSRHLVTELGDSIAYFVAEKPDPGERLRWGQVAADEDFGPGLHPTIHIANGGGIAIAYLLPSGLYPNPQAGESGIRIATQSGGGAWMFRTIEEGTKLGRTLDISYTDSEYKIIFAEINPDEFTSRIIITDQNGNRDIQYSIDGEVRQLRSIIGKNSIHIAWRAENQNRGDGNTDPKYVGDRHIGYLAHGLGINQISPTVVSALSNEDLTFQNNMGLDIALDATGIPYILANTEPNETNVLEPGSILFFSPSLAANEIHLNSEMHPEGDGLKFTASIEHPSALNAYLGADAGAGNFDSNRLYVGAYEIAAQISRDLPDFRGINFDQEISLDADLPGRPGYSRTSISKMISRVQLITFQKSFYRATARRIHPINE